MHSIIRRRERGPDLILYSIPMLSKDQFYGAIQDFAKAGFKVFLLNVHLGTKFTGRRVEEWFLNDHYGQPPHNVVIRCRNQASYVKIYANGKIISTFEIEPVIINFIKNFHLYKRVLRSFPNTLPERFENDYFRYFYQPGRLDVFLKTRFEYPKSIWLANRKENKLYLLDDELLTLKTLAKITIPSYIEANFNFLFTKDIFNSITKPGMRPIFRGKILVKTFIEQIDALLGRPFPRNLKGLKSFIIPEDSKFIFHKPRVKIEGKHLRYLFKILKNYCYDSYHITNASDLI
ncbi:MAG: hypothetical protein QXJ17_04345 [Nitrososphaeria archaeon]